MQPILYSFRRCPYAIRARLAIVYAGINVAQREVELKKKPQAMLDISPKGTVPVLQLADRSVVDESLDIMLWALNKHHADPWLNHQVQALSLIQENDTIFKAWLDKYKYADRFPEQPQAYYREQAQQFLRKLEDLLLQQTFLLDSYPTLADFAIFPFVRQFAFVDKPWFDTLPYPKLQTWLSTHLESTLFKKVMVKYPMALS